MRSKLEKFGSFGAIVAAAACPICFPKLALIGALFGFGVLVEYEVVFFYMAQLMMIFALVGHIISYKRLRNLSLIILACISATLFFGALYVFTSEVLSYLALVGMIAAMAWMMIEDRRCTNSVVSVDK
jgi:mercuric ion transport protein